eukprot:194005_1
MSLSRSSFSSQSSTSTQPPPFPFHMLYQSESISTSYASSTYYSYEEDEKLNMVIAPENNMETDAGLCETEEYFKQKRDAFHANASRKRSLSWSERNTLAKEQEKEKKHALVHKKANYEHRYTLPPKQQAPLIPKSLNDVLRLEQKKKSKSKRRPGARKKAHTHEDVKKGSIQRSSSVHSPPGRGNRKKNFDAPNIESEANRAYIDRERSDTAAPLQTKFHFVGIGPKLRLSLKDDEDTDGVREIQFGNIVALLSHCKTLLIETIGPIAASLHAEVRKPNSCYSIDVSDVVIKPNE